MRANVSELIYEREYAREMLLAAIRHRAAGGRSTAEITALVGQATEAGCGTTQLIVELADLGALLFDTWTPDARLAERLGRGDPAPFRLDVEVR
jgi:hypothetical protein